MKRLLALLAALAAFSALVTSISLASPGRDSSDRHLALKDHHLILNGGDPRTPIRHVVEIFQENVSFDHYFGTYPHAANSDGENFNAAAAHTGDRRAHCRRRVPRFQPVCGTAQTFLPPTPTPPFHVASTATHRPRPATPAASSPAIRTTTTATSSRPSTTARWIASCRASAPAEAKLPLALPAISETVMDYYDGNTVTGLWNYAQHFAMSDNSYGTTFGPSAPGAINLISGDTGSVDVTHEANSPVHLHLDQPRQRHDAGWQGWLLADQ